jgi:hypothetical protein
MLPREYRPRERPVWAMRLDDSEEGARALARWVKGDYSPQCGKHYVIVPHPSLGGMLVKPGMWVVKEGTRLIVISGSAFDLTYEEIPSGSIAPERAD